MVDTTLNWEMSLDVGSSHSRICLGHKARRGVSALRIDSRYQCER